MERSALLASAIIVLVVIVLASYTFLLNNNSTIAVKATTTTSLYATGLLDYLGDKFEEKHPGVSIQFVAVGSGEALRRAASGNACFVLVHAPSLEIQYINQGVLEYHKIFAYNYFIIVGPSDDPAGVRQATNLTDVMERIYRAGEEGEALFISRGDNSGTNVKELQLWKMAGLDPKGKQWYIEIGQGMGETLVMASEKNAYTLSDIGTYLKFKKDGRIPNLEILYSNDTALINIYSAYLVKSCSGEERKAAKEFIDFITSDDGQMLIANYGVDKYGQPLFYPASDKLSMLESTWSELAGQG